MAAKNNNGSRKAVHGATPVVLAGDYNVIPTDIDVYKPERWVDDALFRAESRTGYHALLAQGRTDCLRELHPGERYTRSGTTSEIPMVGMPD
jgi:exonuclease III